MSRKRVTLIGAGLVGRGWAIVFARAGMDVQVYDASEQVLSEAKSEIETNLRDLASAGLLSESEIAGVLFHIHMNADLVSALDGTSYVQESIREILADKQTVLSEVDRIAPEQVIIASSTSALLPSELCSTMRHKERFLVVHPVNPPYLVPFVEIVPSSFSSKKAVDETFELMLQIKQSPIRLKRELPGFVLNRLQVALVNEAISLVNQDVANVADVDQAISRGLGLRWSFMGPFETIDLNAPQGIRDYLQRFQSMYGIAHEMKAQAPFSEALIAKLESQRREVLQQHELEERRQWRDRRLMSVAKHTQVPANKRRQGGRRETTMNLGGKTAIVTGGHSGIGKYIAESLAHAGASVVIAGRDANKLEESARRLRQNHVSVLSVSADVTDEKQVEHLIRQTMETFGGIDILVNNAGSGGRTASIADWSLEDWDAVIDSNLKSVFLCSRAVVPLMIDQAFGRIINISSISGKRPLPYRVGYCTAKIGVIGFTRTLAQELGKHNITVNAVCPGFIEGERIQQVIEHQSKVRKEHRERIEEEFKTASPLNRFVQPEEVAAMCVFLASDHAASITGEDVNVNGGIVMY